MAAAFRALRGRLSEAARAQLSRDQRAWLKRRDACGWDESCLARVIGGRLEALSGRPAPAPVARPSYDCNRATQASEHAICASAELARLDWVLHRAYQDARARLDAAGRDRLRRQQLAWLDLRNRCGWDMSCLARRMFDRAAELDLVAPSPVARAGDCLDLGGGLCANGADQEGARALAGVVTLLPAPAAPDPGSCQLAGIYITRDGRDLGRLEAGFILSGTGRPLAQVEGAVLRRLSDGAEVCRQDGEGVTDLTTGAALGAGDARALCLCAGLLF